MTAIPPWLATMRGLIGTAEVAGPRSNSAILAMAKTVAGHDRRLGWIGEFYADDAIPWCGLAAAYCCVVNGITPPLPNPLSARAWGGWGQRLTHAAPGAFAVFSRTGGGHVGLVEAEDGDRLLVIGGNQSDRVCREPIARSRLLAGPNGAITGLRWPPGVAPPPGSAV